MRYLSLFCLLLLAALPAAAQMTPPEGGEPKPFNLPVTTTGTLDNGLTYTLVPYGELPKVTVTAIVKVGNVDEAAEQVWLADLMGDLMKEGTATRSATQIAEEAARMGGSVSVSVGPDQSSASGTVLSEYGPQLVPLVADILRNPAFPESELDRLKRDRLRNLTIQKSQPGSIALARFREVLYGEHPYGRIFPTEAMVQGFTLDSVKRFYDTHMGAARTHVYVAGRFDRAAMEAAIRQAFAGWQAGTAPERTPPTATSRRAVYLVDQPGAAQSNVYIGMPVVDPSNKDYVALQVTNALLGGAFASRITSNIREDKGYTYSPFSSVSSRFRDAYWAESAAVTTAVTGAAIQEIFNEIERLGNEPPSQEELEGIQNYLAGTFVLQNSTPQGIIGQLAFLNLHGLDRGYLENYVQNVYAVTPAEVQRIARQYLRSGEMTVVVVGDKAAIQEQLTTFGEIVE